MKTPTPRRRKKRYISLSEICVEHQDNLNKTRVRADKKAWQEATKNLPDDAFSNDVPDDTDKFGSYSRNMTPTLSVSYEERFDYHE
jgi:hypothetical protein